MFADQKCVCVVVVRTAGCPLSSEMLIAPVERDLYVVMFFSLLSSQRLTCAF